MVTGRLLIVRAEIEGSVFCFANIYAPNRGTESVFFALLISEVGNYQHDQLIFGGDFNCTLDFTIDRTTEEPHPQSSQSLSGVIAHLDLLDTWRVKLLRVDGGGRQVGPRRRRFRENSTLFMPKG